MDRDRVVTADSIRRLLQDESARTSGVIIRPGERYGFFTDTTLCIGCKACEVACKQWNNLPADGLTLSGASYDNTGALSATTWRHVAFIEQFNRGGQGRWLMMSDVCKHCTTPGCLEACPTGAIVKTEFDTVLIQPDICNGCGYCVPACPFGVITLDEHADAKAHKCTLCYDRLTAGLEPACAKVCPTDSIQFGPVDALRDRARQRVGDLRAAGQDDAYLYGDPGGPGATGGVGGLNCFFLLLDRPEVYNLPPAPEVPSRRLLPASLTSIAAALLLGLATATAFRSVDSRQPAGRAR
ncbi:MAG: 4Fe-4S dicluster domain-containing protein [Chloroflexi bacterium]|nr:4Fe-4S dicluster domain-containing protein [Chloroflexota bacterium]